MTTYRDLALIALRIIEKSMSKSKQRRSFSKSIRNITLKTQKKKCNDCGRESEVWDFDHKDGNNSNNSLENCQALCPNCHAKKTRNIKQKEIKLFQSLKSIKFLLKNL